ncbi:hypothetical protein EDB86DRAFT_3082659 [Lactarius hatsudake]|nr:hypothetical protein EDB86DRAFT_3082659 [Lactarius hatsudake]
MHISHSLTRADLQLDGVEFNQLSSGLHFVEQDVVYFMKDGLLGVCVFARRQTSRAAFISTPSTSSSRAPSALALGATSSYSRPWEIAAGTSGRPASGRQFFWLRKAVSQFWVALTHGMGQFSIDNGGVEDSVDAYEHYTHASPTLYLPHLLRVLGPSSLTL